MKACKNLIIRSYTLLCTGLNYAVRQFQQIVTNLTNIPKD